ncbi:MAG: hypothetical protein A2161_22410 [Candidatus Schekmanbacteria bacterium RBG_13_48_7]|uniref:DUF4412 domain-containing protein n=1 Tax=Candidatus Schekmanbacteria bacterium RBG_13_48_7 TaxID=1817878 RepID=A0A1F7RI34_9BACT|nr:MAG: hypothetical protein A2161_22410 [Candidatus Schekmanbacteria bacterium RBG_13_48_7]
MKNVAVFITVTLIVFMFLPYASYGEDFYLKQKSTTTGMMDQPSQVSYQEIWVTKDKIKSVDTGNNQEFILRLDTGKVCMISPKSKIYTEFEIDKFKEFAKMGMGMLQSQKDNPSTTEVKKTGETQKIGKWNCYQVQVTHTGPVNFSSEMWLTDDLKIKLEDYRHFSSELGVSQMLGDMFEKMKEIKGFPVKQIISMQMNTMNVQTTTEVIDVVIKSIPDTVFDIPEDFKKNDFNMPPAPAKSYSKH